MEVKQFNNVKEWIVYEREKSKQDFEAEYNHIKYHEKCNVYDCICKAEYVWKPSIWIRIKSFFTMHSPSPFVPQYCRKHFLAQTRGKNFIYYRDGFKQIKK